MLPDALAVFDFAEPGFVSGSRETTNVPSQALFLLNSPFIATAAQKLGGAIAGTASNTNPVVTPDGEIDLCGWVAWMGHSR
jgi:hypothetical protein